MHICVPDTQWGQTNLNIGVWRREKLMAGPSKNKWLMLKKSKLPDDFQGSVFIGGIYSEG